MSDHDFDNCDGEGPACFTAVFAIDQQNFEANPFLIDTHWGRPIASSLGDLTYVYSTLCQAIDLVSEGKCENVTSGPGCRSGLLGKHRTAERGGKRWCASCILEQARDEVAKHLSDTRKHMDRKIATK